MIERKYVLYMHTNIINNKKYIGITGQNPPEKRWRNHGSGYLSSQTKIYNAIKKYGWNNFKHEIIFCNLTKFEAENLEFELIKYYKSTLDEFGYNIANGGQKVNEISENTKLKISKSRKGRYLGNKNAFYGKKHTDKSIKIMSKLASKR